MKKVILIFIIVLIILCGVILTMNNLKKEENNANNQNAIEKISPLKNTTESNIVENTEKEINVLATMNDDLKQDSIWCGTFQLIWNDLKNEVVKKDIIFEPQQEKIAENLNKEDFSTKMISEEYYYKKFGLVSPNLKKEIENGIKEKFDQTSDILDSFNWTQDDSRYFFYTMLYRKFEYLTKFNKLENGKFGNDYNNVEYFGIDEEDFDIKQAKQIDVLYYNDINDFAIILNTKTNDEVIMCKGLEGKSFNEVYDKMNEKSDKFEGNKKFTENDKFKAPMLRIDQTKIFEEIKNKPFKNSFGDECRIYDNIQTIKFSLDEIGGEIKSEAGMTVGVTAVMPSEEIRYFTLNDEYVLFLREKGKEKPYFAANINNITNFQ